MAFQGFPSKFQFPIGISNVAKYKQSGNAVSVPVIRRVVEQLLKALKTDKE
ncbi:DNA cytosine methyltransferase [Ureaplasma parvum]|uniref:DNA cytosine methyltransferase n=1 Tax=Ureaplasma parvum TaxID=134821 RepID=UPI0026ECCACB|nr:DNA cytosine methyltransferase [Ureaplasma parvum]